MDRIDQSKWNWQNVIFMAVMHLGALVAIGFFSWQALVLTIFMHWLTGSIGICLGYHRLITHRGFKVPVWLEYIFTTIGALAVEGGPIFWVSTHRQHHSFAEDVELDPYSAGRGFWWSHMNWVLHTAATKIRGDYYQQYAGDLLKHRYYRFLICA